MILIMCIQFIGLVFPVVGCIHLYRKEQSKVTVSLMLSNIGCLLINYAYLLLFSAGTFAEAYTLLKFVYLGNALFYFSFVLFLTNYLGVFNGRSRTVIMAIWGIIELATVSVIWVGDPFGLVFSKVQLLQVGPLNTTLVSVEPGPIYLIRNCLVCSGLLIGMIYTSIRIFKVKIQAERNNLGRLAGAQFVIVAASYIMLIFKWPLDIIPVCCSISIIFIISAVVKGDFFQITDEGRDWVIEHSENIFIMTDKLYGFLDANGNAKEAFPALGKLEKNQLVPHEVQALFMEAESCIEIDGKHYTKKLAAMEQKGKIQGYSLLLMDVSYQFEMMAQLECEKEKAEAANQAKSNFMSTMSHEIRTPMNAIVGMTDIMLREELSENQTEYLQNIKNSGNALLTIINDILDFSKIEAGKMELVEAEYEPMSSLHDMSMIFLNRIGNKDVELIYDIDPALPKRLYGDALRIRQVIINLMNNAIKFTEEGFVKLSISCAPLGEDTLSVLYKVEDSGQGIKKEDIGKLFGNYQQVDTKKNRYKEGTGLGLAISKQLVELMGGSISIESEYGEGSCFSFVIPQKICSDKMAAELREDKKKEQIVCGRFSHPLILEQFDKLCEAYGVNKVQPEEVTGEETKAVVFFTDDMGALSQEVRRIIEAINCKLCILQNPMRQNLSNVSGTLLNKPLYSLNFCQLINGETMAIETEAEVLRFKAPRAKILVVDDHEMNHKVAKGLLAPLQVQIDIAADGKEAVNKVQSNYYDLVLMDHMMPVMDGVEATKYIRSLEGEHYKEMPIVALTANATTEAQELFAANGFNDFVAKPIKLKELCACIRKLLPEHLIEALEEEEDKLAGEALAQIEDKLPVIEGLHVAEGIENSGSKELFLSLLGDFYKLIDKKSTKIEKLLSDGMLRDYTIEVHALKSTARMIGALELSEMFAELEQLGNREEQKILEEKTPAVLSYYRSYKKALEVYGRKDVELTRVDTGIIIEDLEQLKEAMDAFDLDAADAAMKRLETYAFPEPCTKELEELSALVADVAMEEVMALCHKLIEEIQK